MTGGGSKSKGPMVKCCPYCIQFTFFIVNYRIGLFLFSFQQILSSLKNSKQLKSFPQTLQSLAAMKRGGGHGGGGGVKKILPQVLKGIKSKI